MSETRAVVARVFGLMAGFYGFWGITDIDPGEVGILIKKIGTNKGMQVNTLDTGMHWVEPLRYDVAKYDVRFHQYQVEDLPAQSKDGQPILVDASLEIGLEDDKVPYLHENIGRYWYDQVIFPSLRSAVRNETAEHLSDNIYTGNGRKAIQNAVEQNMVQKGEPYGIKITLNLRDLSFTNRDFINSIETKAKESQNVIIAQRRAEQEEFNANRVAETARGEKDAQIHRAEAEKQRLRLEGEGERLQKEEQAKGILAIAKAEAEGRRLMTAALSGPGAHHVVSIKWAEELGPNVKVYGFPLGAEGTTSLFNVDGVLGDALKVKGVEQITQP